MGDLTYSNKIKDKIKEKKRYNKIYYISNYNKYSIIYII